MVLDVAQPASLFNAAFDTLLAGGAMARLGLGHLEQLVGYAQTGTGVPREFLPAGRVLLVTHVEDELVLEGHDVVRSRGRWAAAGNAVEARCWRGGAWDPERLLADVPEPIRGLASESASCWLGIMTEDGAVALPAHWDPGSGSCVVSRSALEFLHFGAPGRMSVTLDDSARRRPDEKLGVMFRGLGSVIDSDDRTMSVRLDVERITHWSGFESVTSATRMSGFAS